MSRILIQPRRPSSGCCLVSHTRTEKSPPWHRVHPSFSRGQSGVGVGGTCLFFSKGSGKMASRSLPEESADFSIVKALPAYGSTVCPLANSIIISSEFPPLRPRE
ncbi:uncharacterized [Tachysurus ichikawai]